MKSSCCKIIVATTILLSSTTTECFQVTSPFQKQSRPAAPENIINTPTFNPLMPNIGHGHGHRRTNIIYATSNQGSDVDNKVQEKGSASTRSVEKNDDNNPFSEMMVNFDDMLKSLNMPDEINDEGPRIRKSDLIRNLLKRLANLSLQDYYWRSDFFKKNEADRQVEESLARMMGEEPAYVRPMDAADEKRGPLGQAEAQLVKWLSLVIEEEGRRARLIASTDGNLVRPMDLEVGGPLSNLESSAVELLERIRSSEKERVLTSTLRPKDLEEEKRGPLGNLEAKVVSALDEIKRSESFRMQQSRLRGGEIVRPIDVPGPLGEMELWYLELITAEKQRVKDRKKNNGELVRPKDASIRGPMGAAERQFTDAMDVIKNEERERLKNVKRFMEEKRPMEADRDSALGFIEALIVGLFRAPQIIFRVVDRVKELMESEEIEGDDKQMLETRSSSKKQPRP